MNWQDIICNAISIYAYIWTSIYMRICTCIRTLPKATKPKGAKIKKGKSKHRKIKLGPFNTALPAVTPQTQAFEIWKGNCKFLTRISGDKWLEKMVQVHITSALMMMVMRGG